MKLKALKCREDKSWGNTALQNEILTSLQLFDVSRRQRMATTVSGSHHAKEKIEGGRQREKRRTEGGRDGGGATKKNEMRS